MKQEGLIQHYGILEDLKSNSRAVNKPERHDVAIKTISLSDDELVQVSNSLEVALVKVCGYGYTSNPLSLAMLSKATQILKSFFSYIKPVSKNFYVDERMVWVEISGLPLCAWGSNAFKKVASSVGKFMFFEKDETGAMSLGRVSIATKHKKFISETTKVSIHGEEYDVYIHELGTWNINIEDSDSYTSETDSKVDEDIVIEEKSGTKKMRKQVWIKEICFKKNIQFLGVQESKMTRVEPFRLKLMWGLFDIPLGGRKFTWMNKAGTKMSKLDRFLVSHSLIDSFPDYKVFALPHGWSDHTPLLLHHEKVDYGPVPFKFFHSWLQRNGFNDCVVNAYTECSYGNLWMTFHDKLKAIKQKIKAWNLLAKTREVSRMHEVNSRLTVMDGKIDSGAASQEEKMERLNPIKECEDIQNLVEMDTAQKAKVKWDVEGDENSKFFH
ncbi:RNA-directed DNA polymerase, eukaryota, reverse transcriptase zinc-binding domain protein [Tanacetum coccineum]